MLSLDDERWSKLEGGYTGQYDARPALRRLRAGDDSAWKELQDNLHHQDDIGEASYAAVPHIVDIYIAQERLNWRFYLLISTIEMCRSHRDNPRLRTWLKAGYDRAWKRVLPIACRDLQRSSDKDTDLCIFSVLLLAKGLRIHAEAFEYGEEGLKEVLDAHEHRDEENRGLNSQKHGPAN